MKDLYFKYIKDDSHWNLENKSNNKKGDFIGIQGVSGSGKLIYLLVGLNVPNKGQFLIDGKPRTLDNQHWIKQIGYVSQNVILVDDTILQNIALGRKVSEVDLDEINFVIEKSGLKEFIDGLKKGLEQMSENVEFNSQGSTTTHRNC